jgi:integrase
LGLKNTKENWKIAEGKRKEKLMQLWQQSPHVDYTGTPHKFDDAVKIFLESKVHVSSGGYDKYKSAFDAFRRTIGGNIRLEDINEKTMKLFGENMKRKLFYKKDGKLRKGGKLSRTTKAGYHNSIKILLSYCEEEGWIKKNRIKLLTPPDPVIFPIPAKELHAILLYFRLHNIKQYRVVKFLALTGLRKGDLVKIAWEDIDLERGIITFENMKADRPDEIKIIPSLEKLLLEFENRSGYLFNYKPSGMCFFERGIKRMYNRGRVAPKKSSQINKKYSELLSHKYTIHDLRRTLGTNIANMGVKNVDLMKALRHRDIRTTLKYYAQQEINRIGDIVQTAIDKN